jgi:protein-histidine N-methyltransferase
MSPSSASYRAAENHPNTDPTSPGELPISPSLVSAFLASLKSQDVKLRFFAGSWETFDLTQAAGRYDVVLSSETIYRMDSLGPLIDFLEGACGGGKKSSEATSLPSSSQTQTEYICLVAAKLVYFGVGGGVAEFKRAAEGENPRGRVETVWERNVGVGRRIMEVKWER